MAKVFRTSSRESSILSKIESSKEHARRMALKGIVDCMDPLSRPKAKKSTLSRIFTPKLHFIDTSSTFNHFK